MSSGHRLGVGVPLHPSLQYLEECRSLIEDDADFYEVNPEALWRPRDGVLRPSDSHLLFQDLQRRSGKPFVAHGLAFSLGSSLENPHEQSRTQAWLDQLRDDQETFRFEWLSEHLGWTQVDGLNATLPLPLPFSEEAVQAVSARMRLLRGITPRVAFENNADYFSLGKPSTWPDFINRLCRDASCGLLLDLHNLFAQCRNLGQDPVETLDRLDLDAVLELHVSGGSESDSSWLTSGRGFRLDSHDGPVPEAVWSLLERALPRCRNARGLVVERLDGTFGEGDVDRYRDEVRRARELFRC